MQAVANLIYIFTFIVATSIFITLYAALTAKEQAKQMEISNKIEGMRYESK